MIKKALLICCATLLLVACQLEQTVVWDGKIARSFSAGDGTQSDPYIISSTQEFALFLTKGGGYHYKLTQDLNMHGDNLEEAMICPQLSEFSGSLDGGNFLINTILFAYTTDSKDHTALIGTLTGTIKNLGISGVITDEARQEPNTYKIASSAFVAQNRGTISNCLLKDRIYAFGGFAHTNAGLIEYCLNAAAQFGDNCAPNGGIVAANTPDGVIRGCAFVGIKITEARNNFVRVYGSIAGHNFGEIEGCFSACTHAIEGPADFTSYGKNYKLTGCYTADKEAKLLAINAESDLGAQLKDCYASATRSPKKSNYAFDYKYLSESSMQSLDFLTLLNKASKVRWIEDNKLFNDGYPIPEQLLPVFEWSDCYGSIY